MALFNYIMRKVWLHQTRIGLSLYDITGQGFLRESDLENYILELIETLPQLDGLEKSFHPFYVCTAVRKFFFFLDPSKTGKIKIQDVLACSFLDDLLELRDQELSKEVLLLPRELFELKVCIFFFEAFHNYYYFDILSIITTCKGPPRTELVFGSISSKSLWSIPEPRH